MKAKEGPDILAQEILDLQRAAQDVASDPKPQKLTYFALKFDSVKRAGVSLAVLGAIVALAIGVARQ